MGVLQKTPASRRSVAEASFANSGFVARTRFGVFGQATSRYASRTLRRGFPPTPHDESALPIPSRFRRPRARCLTASGSVRVSLPPLRRPHGSRPLWFQPNGARRRTAGRGRGPGRQFGLLRHDLAPTRAEGSGFCGQSRPRRGGTHPARICSSSACSGGLPGISSRRSPNWIPSSTIAR